MSQTKIPKNGAEIPVGSHKQKTMNYILDLWKYKWTQRISKKSNQFFESKEYSTIISIIYFFRYWKYY